MKVEDHAGIPSIITLKTLNCFTENEGENSLLQTLENIEIPRSSFSVSNIDPPRKNNFLTSTPNNKKSFMKQGTLSISNIKVNDVNMSSHSEVMLPVTAESHYEGQVTDIDDCNAQQGVIQITIAEPVIMLNQVGNDYHKTTLQLIDIPGKSKLITEYDKYKRKVEKYPAEEMYLDDLRKIIAQLELKLKLKAQCLKKEIVDIQQKKLKDSYVGISLLPTDGPDKLHLDNLMDKLKYITLLKQTFYVEK